MSSSETAAARRVRVWDLPTRLFHWNLAALVAAAFATGWIGGNAMDWHGRAGIAIAGLLAFRLTWGLVGSTYARFASFVRGPGAVRAYLNGQWQGVGHNPLGGLSVLTLLALIGFQVLAGLYGNDDIAFNGPLYRAVSKDASDWLTGLHRINVWLLLGIIALHLAAIAYYVRVRRDDLVKPMLTGVKVVRGAAEPARGGGWLAFLAAALIAAAAVWVADGGWLPPPAAPAAGQTPTW